MIEAVTFDVTHTLIHSPRLGEIYAEVLNRHGLEIDAEEARRLISVVWQELSCSADPGRDRFASHPEGERGWWSRFLERVCELKEAPPRRGSRRRSSSTASARRRPGRSIRRCQRCCPGWPAGGCGSAW